MRDNDTNRRPAMPRRSERWRIPTVRDVIDALIAPVGTLGDTVDTLKCGDPQAPVTGIVTAFMPTQRVLERAIGLGANLVIAHEGLYFSHRDTPDESKSPDAPDADREDPVLREKRELLRSSGLAVFRFHDYWHRYSPDGVMEGLIRRLGWEPYVREHRPTATIAVLPQTTVGEVAAFVKRRLDLPYIRLTGEPRMACSSIGLLVGYRGGGTTALPLFGRDELELIVCGEGPEWETPEYVRDAVHQGRSKALIVLGHAQSEEPGMEWLAERLRRMYPGLRVHHVKERPVFDIL